ncbi:MAG: hypothetical protein M3024_16450 [Candidatus Dormibacteraeota bacterium]|nr:hypothetical protein [Candidatus Dormibacteraeota bacterium]
MAPELQTHCDRCETPLRRNAAYCERCGERTHRARWLVRTAVRIEVVFFLLIALLVTGFTWIFYVQPPK